MSAMQTSTPPKPGQAGWQRYVETDPAPGVSRVFKTATPSLIKLGLVSVGVPLVLSVFALLVNTTGDIGTALAMEGLALKITALAQLLIGLYLAVVMFAVLDAANKQFEMDGPKFGRLADVVNKAFVRFGFVPAVLGAIAFAEPLSHMLNAMSSGINSSTLSSLSGSTGSLAWGMLVGTLMQLVVMAMLIVIPLVGVHGLVQTKESMNDSYNRYTGNLYGSVALNFYRLVIGVGVLAFGLALWGSTFNAAMATVF